nr:NusG domain II-containing protein [Desulfuromonadales bacterium]
MALKDVWQRTTGLDRLVVAGVALGCAASFALFGSAASGERVVVLVDGEPRFVGRLDDQRTVRLQGPLGETIVSIGNGRVCVLDSPCPHKVCMGMGAVSRSGELVACVPNRLLIRIEGAVDQAEGEYDLLSR